MQYNHRSRLPPPPPPFVRGGTMGYPRGHKQLYAPPPPPLPPAPPPPQRKSEVLMEAGRLAAEYLVSQGVLPPASLQRGAGAWAPPLPPPPPHLPPQQQEPPAFYGRRRYEDDYNNPSARPRRTNGSSSSSSTTSRDDYSSGSYNGRGKRKYGEYRREYPDSGRDREERGRAFPNGRRDEDEDEDGAPGFRRDRRGSRGSDEVRSSVTEAAREETSLMAKAVGELEMEDARSKDVSSIGDVRKDADAPLEAQGENEEGEMDDDSKALNSESEVVEQAVDGDANDASTGLMDDDSKVFNSESEVVEQGIDADANNASTGLMESEPKHLSDGKIPGEKAEDGENISDEAAVDHITFDVEVTNVENNMHDGRTNLLDYSDFARAPTRPRSARAQRNAATVPGETSVADTVDLASSGQASQMVIGESAKESSLTNTQSENREDQICQENTNSSVVGDEPMEPMLLQENGASVVTENMREEKGDAQLHVVQEYKEETNLSPLTASHKDSLPQEDSMMQETDLSPLIYSHRDRLPQENSLMQETDLPRLTASHKDSLIEETELSPLAVSNNDSLVQETHLSQAMSSHENNFKLQFKEGTQICDIDTLPQDVGLIELSDLREIVGAELCPNVGAEADIEMEGGKLDQSRSLKVSDLDLVSGTEVAALHNDITLAQSSAAGSSTERHKKHQDDPGTTAGADANATDDLCQLPLENKDVQVIDIYCDTLMEVGDFGSSKSKNEMMCSSIDNMMHPGLHTDVRPGIQDGYSLAFSDFLGADIPCYPPMQSDLHAGIGANDSEGITIMDDPIYGSLTDIGLMDVWGQPAEDYDKFF